MQKSTTAGIVGCPTRLFSLLIIPNVNQYWHISWFCPILFWSYACLSVSPNLSLDDHCCCWWIVLLVLSDHRGRLDSTTDQWKPQLKRLCDFNDWLTKLEAEMRALQPPGGDLESLKSQEDDLQVSMLIVTVIRNLRSSAARNLYIL